MQHIGAVLQVGCPVVCAAVGNLACVGQLRFDHVFGVLEYLPENGSPCRTVAMPGVNKGEDDDYLLLEPEEEEEDEDDDWSSKPRRYRFPLRSDWDVNLRLPDDMTRREGKRMAAFIKSLSHFD